MFDSVIMQSRLRKTKRATSNAAKNMMNAAKNNVKVKCSKCSKKIILLTLMLVFMFALMQYHSTTATMHIKEALPLPILPTVDESNDGLKDDVFAQGMWNGADVKHVTDEGLKNALNEFWKNETVNSLADFGCGDGSYSKHFAKQGFTVSCFDGNPAVSVMTDGRCKELDLSKRFNLAKTFDWVMSLEVGEHIPHEFETVFLDNLHRHNTHGIVLSWSLKGQSGKAHVNNQNNEYIKSKMSDLGYWSDVMAETKLRRSIKNLWWFRNTLMVFRKVSK